MMPCLLLLPLLLLLLPAPCSSPFSLWHHPLFLPPVTLFPRPSSFLFMCLCLTLSISRPTSTSFYLYLSTSLRLFPPNSLLSLLPPSSTLLPPSFSLFLPLSPSPRSKDLYHTCYCLSGLSVAQHTVAAEALAEDPASGAEGPKDATLLRETHAAFNICADKVCLLHISVYIQSMFSVKVSLN